MSLKIEHQAPDSLERHAMLSGEEVGGNKLLRLLLTPGEEQLARLGQYAQSLRAVVPVRPAAPDSLFIQLNLLINYSAIDHGAQTRISQRQRFGPHLCRLPVPELQIIGFGHHAAYAQQAQTQ